MFFLQIREVDWDPAEDEEGGSSDGTNEDDDDDEDDGDQGNGGDQMEDDDQIDIRNDPNLIMIKPDPDGKRPVQVNGACAGPSWCYI